MIPSVFRSLGSSDILISCKRLCPLKLQPTSSAMQINKRNNIKYQFELRRAECFCSSTFNAFQRLLYFKEKRNEFLCWKSYVFVISTALLILLTFSIKIHFVSLWSEAIDGTNWKNWNRNIQLFLTQIEL